MPTPLLPEGTYPEIDTHRGNVTPEDKIALLEERVRMLESEMEARVFEQKHLEQATLRTIGRLLSPLYKALKPIFGEMEAVGQDSQDVTIDKRVKWDMVKQRLAPRLREAVDILLMQGTMKRTQLASALKMDYSNCTKNVVGVLKSQGWIVESGGNLSLKVL